MGQSTRKKKPAVKRFLITMDVEMYASIKALAQAEDRPMNAQILRMLRARHGTIQLPGAQQPQQE